MLRSQSSLWNHEILYRYIFHTNEKRCKLALIISIRYFDKHLADKYVWDNLTKLLIEHKCRDNCAWTRTWQTGSWKSGIPISFFVKSTYFLVEEHGMIPKKSFDKGRFSTYERVIRQIKEMFSRCDTPIFPERHDFPDQIFPRLPAYFAIAPISH